MHCLKVERIKEKCKENKGFTLIEITVTLVILGIVLAVAGNVFFFGTRMYTQTEAKNAAKSIGDSAFKYCKRAFTYATEMDIVYSGGTAPTGLSNNIRINEAGHLMKNNSNVLGSSETDYYNGYSLSYSVKKQNNTILELTIKVSKNNEELYTKTETVKNVNLSSGNHVIETSGSVSDNPTVYYNTASQYDNANDNPLAMYNLMVNLWNSVNASPSTYPSDYQTYTGVASGVSNEYFRRYIAQKYYNPDGLDLTFNMTDDIINYWPVAPSFTTTVINATNAKANGFDSYIKNTDKKLKMQVYLNSSSGLAIVYLSKSGTDTAAQMIYNPDDGYWYFNKTTSYDFSAKTWDAVKSEITGSSWVKVAN